MKKIFKLMVVVVVALGLLRFFFPPLTELGYATPETGANLQIMYARNGGVNPLLIYVETREGIDFESISAELGANLIADRATGALPLKGLPEQGKIEFRFVSGGRYFYRFAEQALVIASYDAETITEIVVVDGSSR